MIHQTIGYLAFTRVLDMANQNTKATLPCSVDLNSEIFMPTPNCFQFPYDPYPSQVSFMQKLYSVVEAKKQGIFESPTGTGKTMSIICGIITWLNDHDVRVNRKYTGLISDLEQRFLNNPLDWFVEQSRDIIIRKEIDKVKIEQSKFDLYMRKLDGIANRKDTLKNGVFPQMLASQEIPDETENTNVDDYLLEDDNMNTADTVVKNENEDYKPTQIFISSRTHSQLAQFVDELKKSPFGENTRIVTLASRQNTCICPSVKKLGSSAAINERCLEMQKSSSYTKVNTAADRGLKRKRVAAIGKCQFYNQDLVESLSELALCEPQDIEDLVLKGEKMRACPYYASRKASKFAEIILAPYNTILHRETREANGINLKGSVLIVDEAHNLLDALCGMNGATLNEDHVITSIYQLCAYRQNYNKKLSFSNLLLLNQTVAVLEGIRDFLAEITESAVYKTLPFLNKADISHFNIHSLCAKIKRSLLLRKVQGFAKSRPHLIEDIVQALEAKKLKKPFSTVRNPQVGSISSVSSFLTSISTTGKSVTRTKTLLTKEKLVNVEVNHARVASAPLHTMLVFMQAITSGENSSRILVHYENRSEHEPRIKRSLEYLVLDPSQQFADVVKDCRAVIVTGGTMKPIEEVKQRLFVKAGARREDVTDCTWGHIIPPENISPIVVDNAGKSIRFDFQNRNSMTDVVVNVLKQFSSCKTKSDGVHGGIVVFFTSYQYMNFVVERTKDIEYERPLLVESQEPGSVQRTLDEYVSAVRRNPTCGAMIFCVMGGKLSEGINFKDDLGRLIILFGLPYPYQESIEFKERLAYIQLTEGAKNAKEMGLIMCMKTVNQCIGRAIRHKGDFAAVLLIDERYKRPEVQSLLPDWIQTQLQQNDVDVAFRTVTNFLLMRHLKIQTHVVE